MVRQDGPWRTSDRDAAAWYKLNDYLVSNNRGLNTRVKTWTCITWTMPCVSATDWLNSQCADRLISVVLIGQSLAQVATSYRPTNTTESRQHPHYTFKEPFTTHTHTYIQHTIHTSTHNIYSQLSKYGIASHKHCALL